MIGILMRLDKHTGDANRCCRTRQDRNKGTLASR